MRIVAVVGGIIHGGQVKASLSKGASSILLEPTRRILCPILCLIDATETQGVGGRDVNVVLVAGDDVQSPLEDGLAEVVVIVVQVANRLSILTGEGSVVLNLVRSAQLIEVERGARRASELRAQVDGIGGTSGHNSGVETERVDETINEVLGRDTATVATDEAVVGKSIAPGARSSHYK